MPDRTGCSEGHTFNKPALIKAIVWVMLLLAAGTLFALGVDLKGWVVRIMELLRTVGPTFFFTAMALLPAIGAPMSFFCLAAGSVFASQLGMPVVLALALAAIATNMAISWLLAKRFLHPPLQAMLQRLGYRIPQVHTDNVTDLVILVRVTPGIPFPVQNYLLGLAAVPFPRYMLISSLVAFPLNAAIIYFGESLVQGAGGKVLVGLLLLVALLAAIHMLRRRYRSPAGPTPDKERPPPQP